MSFKNRFKYAVWGENGSPMTETIIAITVSLCVIAALIGVGAVLLAYIGSRTESVVTL